jgi:hypothetical protein
MTMSGAHRAPSRPHRSRALVSGVSTALLLAVVPATAASAASRSSGGLPCPPLVAFDPGHFHAPTEIDNRFLPMAPGTQHVYTGTTSGGAHQIVSTVTDLTKVVDGVTARVVRETDIQDGQVTEDELTLFAQDDAGNVWNLAEHPELFNARGKATGAPDTWVSGQRSAQAGIHMLAQPKSRDVRNKPYLQGYSPSIDFLDCARVHSVDRTTTVPVGTFSDVLTTYETSPLEQTTAIQTKAHAPFVGIVRVGAINDPEAETLELTSDVTLDPSARSKVDREALQLDDQGRKTNKVWARTPPARLVSP